MNDAYNYLDCILKSNDTVLIGCSGGPDSMALLYLLYNMRNKKNINIIVAFVNHNVRKESYDELLFVKDYCKKHKIIFESMTIEKYSDDNFENEARNIRYNYFSSLIKKYDCNYLMTAHHGDDLVETILMRIVRGSTLKGYSGFGMEVDKGTYKIVRPLVYTTKEEILEFNKKNKIPYVIDKTNFMDIHTRNRYRKVVLPFLKKEDKNVHLKFLKYSNMLQMYDDYINSLMDQVLKDVIVDEKIDVLKYSQLDEIFKIKVINSALEKYYQDDLILITDVHVNLIKNLILSNKANGYIYLPNDIKVVKTYNYVSFTLESALLDSYEIEINDYVFLPNKKKIERVSASNINNNYYCRLNSSDVVLPLHVRTRKAGDKMKVKNMIGSKKVNEIFIDMKIPAKDRDLWPIVVDSKDTIVWIPGLKKSKYDVPKNKKCDIILKYN